MKILNNRRFVWLIIGLFVVQAVWIALSGRYPMAFDEEVHLGIIQLYANHISPIWSAQPDGANSFGVVYRDPSYLFHYLSSFLYQLIDLVTNSQYVQVVFLRFINIAMFGTGIYIFWLLLQKFRAPLSIIHSVLLLFILIPVVPLLAAQINYDNLLFPLVGLFFVLAIDLMNQLTGRKLSLKTVYWFIVVTLSASLVKYAFLPIAFATFALLAVTIFRNWDSLNLIKQLKQIYKQFKSVTLPITILGTLLIIVLAGLFSERYAINFARYQRPAPECTQALSIEQCKEHGPWNRDYILSQNKKLTDSSPINYTKDWLHGMWFRLFFAVDGKGTGYQTRSPLTLPSLAAIALFVIGLIALCAKSKAIWNKYERTAILITVSSFIVYIISLWREEYKAFLKSGVPVAINGRYLIPVLLPVLLIAALAINELLKKWPVAKKAFLIISLVCLLYGGGAMTYMLRSNPAWYWPNSIVEPVNSTFRRTFGPLTPGFNQPNQYWP